MWGSSLKMTSVREVLFGQFIILEIIAGVLITIINWLVFLWRVHMDAQILCCVIIGYMKALLLFHPAAKVLPGYYSDTL